MRRLLLATFLLFACDPSTPGGGTLGLPSSRPSQTAAPATSVATAPQPTASASASPSRSPTASASPTATSTASPTPTATATAGDTTPPGIVAASATQLTLTVVFSEPMKTDLGCGVTGGANGSPATIDDRRNAYRSNDLALDETLASATRATIGADCSSITFEYALAAPAGTYTLTVTGVQDLAGNVIETARSSATLRIQDDGRPVAIGADALGDRIFVTFSEPMLKIGEGGGVTMSGNYRLDGNVPPITQITCNDAGCRSISIALAAGTLVRGRTYTLRIANVVDRSGLGILPDPSNVTFTDR